MANGTHIEWADDTFNPWWGCTKVSPGCEHCYAEAFSARMRNDLWGPSAGRRLATESYWAKPLSWNATAMKKGKSRRVFVASMADVCEDRADLDMPRRRLMRLVEDTPALTWMLLTKRPENFRRLFAGWGDRWPANVWAMATVENQEQADRRIPELLRVPAKVRGLSCEPLLGSLDIACYLDGAYSNDDAHPSIAVPRIDWVIAGGESGSWARPPHPYWVRALRDQCLVTSVPFLFKQWGGVAPDLASFRTDSLRGDGGSISRYGS